MFPLVLNPRGEKTLSEISTATEQRGAGEQITGPTK